MFQNLARHPWRSTLWLIAGFALLHLLVIGRVELTGDEAHYALYGYHPDWSYFDHPPLVGWLNALVLPFSASDFALRLWPLLLGALTSLLLFGLTRELFPSEPAGTALLAVAVYQSGALFQLLNMAMLPDTPLLPIALGATWLLYRALHTAAVRDWLGVGLLFGLAGLAKYTAVTLVLTTLIALFWLGRARVLRTPGLWLAIPVALLVITPILYWNAAHDWISFAYQLGHGAPDRTWSGRRFLTAQAGQLVAYGPLIYGFGLIALVAALRSGHPGERLLLALALPVLLLFAWNGGYETTLPHWPALGWLALSPLIARWLIRHWPARGVRVAAWSGAVYSLLLIAAIHLLILLPFNPFPPGRHPLGDRYADVYGWRTVARQAATLRAAMAATPGPEPRLYVGNWSIFSHLAWYARPLPVQVTDTRFDQSDLWYGSPAPGDRGIVVVPEKYWGRPDTAGFGKFAHCAAPQLVAVPWHGVPASRYRLYACEGYRGES